MLRALREIEQDLRSALCAVQDVTADVAHDQVSPVENLGKVTAHSIKAYEAASELLIKVSQQTRRVG